MAFVNLAVHAFAQRKRAQIHKPAAIGPQKGMPYPVRIARADHLSGGVDVFGLAEIGAARQVAQVAHPLAGARGVEERVPRVVPSHAPANDAPRY